MKRIAVYALLGVTMTFGLLGCAEKAKVQETKTVQTEGGTTKKTTTVEETKTGDHKDNAPPANP